MSTKKPESIAETEQRLWAERGMIYEFLPAAKPKIYGSWIVECLRCGNKEEVSEMSQILVLRNHAARCKGPFA